jgi:hypothetical protein
MTIQIPTANFANTISNEYNIPLHTTLCDPLTDPRERMGRAEPIDAKNTGDRMVIKGGAMYFSNADCGVCERGVVPSDLQFRRISGPVGVFCSRSVCRGRGLKPKESITPARYAPKSSLVPAY